MKIELIYCTLIYLISISCNTSPNKQEPSQNNKFTPAKVAQEINYINPLGTTVKERINLPTGFSRLEPASNSFAHYVQNFPLKADGEKVYYYNKIPKYTQKLHLAVLDIDTGNRDLQQCADAVMRLRAEYLFEQKQFDKISFNFTNGFPATYLRWKNGERIKVNQNEVSWYGSHGFDDSYKSFRNYLNMVFSYAGTLSLNKELVSKKVSNINIGDVFIQGGSPGHAVIVVDVAMSETSNEKIFLMAQSYMPAQDIHIIKKTKYGKYGPWYSTKEIKNVLQTPEWTFHPEDLKTF